MTLLRGQIHLVDYPFTDGSGTKARPALIVQNDLDNARLLNTIVVQITGLTRRALEPTQYLIELSTLAGMQSGLILDSVVNCANLCTLHHSRIIRLLGSLPPASMADIEGCLKAALAIS